MADQVPVNGNYAWKAIRASSFVAGDTQLAEFSMAVTGTLIVTAPSSDSDARGPRVRILKPLALDRRVTEVLMEGGGALPVYRCDTTASCLNPTLGTATIPPDRGFRARVSRAAPGAEGARLPLLHRALAQRRHRSAGRPAANLGDRASPAGRDGRSRSGSGRRRVSPRWRAASPAGLGGPVVGGATRPNAGAR